MISLQPLNDLRFVLEVAAVNTLDQDVARLLRERLTPEEFARIEASRWVVVCGALKYVVRAGTLAAGLHQAVHAAVQELVERVSVDAVRVTLIGDHGETAGRVEMNWSQYWDAQTAANLVVVGKKATKRRSGKATKGRKEVSDEQAHAGAVDGTNDAERFYPS
jgi:hypothetical protein